MTLEAWLIYVTTVFIFLLSPGPSHMYMLSTSLSYGFSKSWATGAGDLSAHVWQVAVASIGLVGVIYTFQEVFIIFKWVGVCFLVYLGVKQFMKKDSSLINKADRNQTRMNLYFKGLATASANPKAVVFFAALFPQFVNPEFPAAHQFVILGLTYIAIDACFLIGYGISSSWLRRRFEGHMDRYLNRVSGSLLIGSALLLGLKDIQGN